MKVEPKYLIVRAGKALGKEMPKKEKKKKKSKKATAPSKKK